MSGSETAVLLAPDIRTRGTALIALGTLHAIGTIARSHNPGYGLGRLAWDAGSSQKERINITLVLLWIVVLATVLLGQTGRSRPPGGMRWTT